MGEMMMMNMWFWSGYNMGDLLFKGLKVDKQWTFAVTWIVLFLAAFAFEASKVFLAKIQRQAQTKLYPHRRSDERRTLLHEREQGMEPTTSRNSEPRPPARWTSMRVRVLMVGSQSLLFVLHNVAGYLLMLVVMLYNVYLLLAVVLGMMMGYFFFGTQLTILQMKCFGTKKLVICTPECDDTAASSTPPLLDHSSSESDVFICQTRACAQPSHYFPANTQDGGTSSCHYGAKQCPSKVARAKKAYSQSQCGNGESEKEDSPGVENAQLLRTERQGCCKKKQEPPPDSCCSKNGSSKPEPENGCCKKKTVEEESHDERPKLTREESPQITCCHNAKSVTTESQEQIVEK
ncbi:hypothetical protein JYU34_013786 [Plutella xylostella]|uniref:Copper transport protein n=1 Tax=Plutella xylostella TaxID=51655 RepID=A0ABQ7QAN0_PLUXY|nr:hypothetical protein JYU34_013786 [Plutella xylostella]